MRKEYFKPITEIIEVECIQHIAFSDDWADGKDNRPDENDDDLWNPHYNVWDK